MPLATVWIPSYNYGRFLPAAIESVLGQTHRDLELIVWDDGSTDDSFEIAQRYTADDPRIRVLHHAGRRNLGLPATLIAASRAANGAYVCGLAADDVLVADSLSRRIAALDATPEALFAYGVVERVDEDGASLGLRSGLPPARLQQTYGTADQLEALLLRNYVPGPSVLLRREAMERVGGTSPSLVYSDWDLWARLLALGPGVFVDPPSVAYERSHGRSLSLTARPDVELTRRVAVFRAIDEHADGQQFGRLREPRISGLISLQRAWHEFTAGDVGEARASVERAFARNPHLAHDPDYLLWWLSPVQYAGRHPWFVPELLRTRTSSGALLAKGVEHDHFGCWFVCELSGLAGEATARRVFWGMVANELEATSSVRPAVVVACLRRFLAEPRLAREPWFVKSILCGLGLWDVALGARARLSLR